MQRDARRMRVQCSTNAREQRPSRAELSGARISQEETTFGLADHFSAQETEAPEVRSE